MTDEDKIKFAIRYLKKGLKSKRTPPLYEELMKELGFVKKDKVNNLSSVAEVRLANWQRYEKENKELKEKVSFLEDNLRVARKDREKLQLDIAKGLKEFVKDYPATAIRFMANEKYVEENDRLNKELGKVEGKLADLTSEYYELENLKNNEISELKEAIKHFNPCCEWDDDVHDCEFRHYAMEYGNKLAKAKEIIKRLIKETYGEGWNYSLQVKVEAEKFLKECE